ncbi:PepSY domain-containing protein, partial [Peribacillus sp. NPDC058076]
PGTVKDVELEDEDGTVVYGVEVQAKDGSKQDVKIDAQTGKIVKVESDDEEENGNEENDGEENDKQEQAALAKKAKLTEAESKKIALEKVPGTVKDVELEDEDGTVVYGVEVQAKDGSKQDVKIDAQTGKIVKVESDDEDKNENDKE